MESCKELRENNPYLFNSWRAILYTEIRLTYNGETKTLREWSEEYGMSYNGLLIRYLKNKNYTIEEILFGKKRKPKSKSIEDERI